MRYGPLAELRAGSASALRKTSQSPQFYGEQRHPRTLEVIRHRQEGETRAPQKLSGERNHAEDGAMDHQTRRLRENSNNEIGFYRFFSF